MKIDRAFVRDIVRDRANAAIVEAIVAMGRTLRLDVIAEGVETESQQEFLKKTGCHVFQGFLFSRPVPAGDLDAFLAARNNPFGTDELPLDGFDDLPLGA